MLDERFLAAWIPAKHRVLGQTMPAFSLWHHLLLTAVESPLLFDADNALPSDLILAARLCSDSWPKVGIRKRPSVKDRLWHFRLRRNNKLFARELNSFGSWIADNLSEPSITIDDGAAPPGPGSGVPFLLQIAVTLLVNTTLSEREVWTMPYGRALWYHTAITAQKDDSLHVVSTQEEAEIERLQALMDAMP
jgi:hypothetical protein